MNSDAAPRPSLELWGGIECTVNRVGDAYSDQVARSGHDDRLDDLDRFAALGIRALRYPVLWERTAPDGIEGADWRWADARLGRLRELGVRPIVGLVHHGSGPRQTSLLDPAFPRKLARFAGAVAARYPWVTDYTPVNEPLTTARFSALYGHWYPHHRSDLSWARALLIQCAGIAAAMRAIRAVNPAARLIQTEDLGQTHSTPALAYQAEFENARRWLTYDLLLGRVDTGHDLWGYLTWLGISEAELGRFRDEPCPPDIIGINHYLTGERFLDERRERYPSETHGSNGCHSYADVEAVRVLADGIAGPADLLRQTWDRYRRPIAVTEVHLGCTREEQLRWLAEVWDAARTLRHEGADVRAVTAWSLLGAYDWHCLLTRVDGHYEPGVFDLRAPSPRPTALAHLLRELAAGRNPTHPILAGPGWWQRRDRLLYPAVDGGGGAGPLSRRPRRRRAQPILILGERALLGDAIARHCRQRGLAHQVCSPAAPDVVAALAADRPWAVIHAEPLADAPTDQECDDWISGTTAIAAACAAHGIALATFSSGRVFDGSKPAPYVERDRVSPPPFSAAGRAEAAVEQRVLARYPGALVIRTGLLLGAHDDPVAQAWRALGGGVPFAAATEPGLSLSYAPDLADACLDLLIDAEVGIWHVTHQGTVNWAELVRQVAGWAELDPGLVVPRPGRRPERWPQPGRAALASERGWLLSTVDDALRRRVQEEDWPRVALRPADRHRNSPSAWASRCLR